MKRILAALAALFLVGTSAALAISPLIGNATPATRQLPMQLVHTYRATVNFNDPTISSAIQFGSLPAGSSIVAVQVEIVTAFNAATTNVLTFGTTTTATELVNAGDLNEAATGVTSVTRGLGQSLTASADTGLYAKYTQTGTAATAGKAIVTIQYIPNNDQ
jgi:hypothetical protein